MTRGFTVASALATIVVSAVSCAAATLTVINTNEGNVAGSLRQAIQNAFPDDTIVFNIPTTDPGYDSSTKTWKISLTSAALVINKNLTIDGGSQHIVVRWGGVHSAAVDGRIFDITSGTVRIAHLTIADGFTSSIASGIRNAGTLTASACTFTGNSTYADGAALYNIGTATLVNSTVANNTCSNASSSIVTNQGGTMTILSCTIAFNTSGSGRPGVGIANNSGTVHVGNSVIAKNGVPIDNTEGDVYGAFVSDGYNFIGAIGSATGFGGPGSYDQFGNKSQPADPNLQSLQDNGGPTQTSLPLAGSLLIDNGNSFGLTVDQRDRKRPIDNPTIVNVSDSADIGAVETDVAQTGPTFTVNTTDEHSDQFCGVQDCSLWDAANASGAYAVNTGQAATVTFAPGVTGTITTALQASGIGISHDVTYIGPGADALTISGAGVSRVFNITGGTVNISGLTIASGMISDDGGGILNNGNLSLSNCIVAGNFALGGHNGGGIANTGTLALTDVTLSGNSAASGGGIYNATLCTATNVSFVANRASPDSGGGIYNDTSNASLTLTNCTLSGNTADFTAGAINNVTNGRIALTNVTLSGNAAPGYGGIQSFAPITVTNTIFATGAKGANCGGFSGGAANLSDDNTCGFTTAGDPLQRDNVTDLLLGPLADNGGFTPTHLPQPGSRAIDNGTGSGAPATDQRNLPRPQGAAYDVGAVEVQPTPVPTPTPTPTPVSQLQNLSTRKQVGTGDDVLIGGFIIAGSDDKKVLLRGLGPSLPLSGALADPVLELHRGDSTLLAANDNWRDASNASEIAAILPPSRDAESAILTTVAAKPLNEGGAPYTGILAGKDGTTGIGLLEIYDLNTASNSTLANISTRGFVGTGDDLLIGGFIPGPSDRAPLNVLMRALGPSLVVAGVSGALDDPVLELHDANGAIIVQNDNWPDAPNAAEIQSTLPPPDRHESAIMTTLAPSNSGYTAVVRGANDMTGVALVEVYALQ